MPRETSAMELSPSQIEKEWKAGKFRPVYYFLGEDAFSKSGAARKLKAILKLDDFNLSEFSSDAGSRIDEIISTILTPPMFAARRLVIVKAPKLGVEAKRKLAEYLAGPLETTTLVLFCDDRKPDIRDALTAAAAAHNGIVSFRPLNNAEAAAQLEEAAGKAGTPFGPDAADLLVAEAGTDRGILDAELRKLLLYARGKKAIGREDVLACLGYRQSLNPYEFGRTLRTRDAVRSLKTLRRSFSEGADAFGLLYQITGTLNKQLKAKRLAKSGAPEAQIFRELRLSAYYDRDYMRQLATISEAQLAADLRACVETEAGLKSKTWLSPEIELERLVARICGSRAATEPRGYARRA